MTSLILTDQFSLTNCSHGRTLSDNLLTSFQNGEKTDTVFICQNQRVLYAHRAVLAAASPFFRYLLQSYDPHNDIYISVTDYEFSLVEKMLAFLYSGEVYLTRDEESSFTTLLNELEVWGCSLVEIARERETTTPTTLTDIIRNTVLEDIPEELPADDLDVFGSVDGMDLDMDSLEPAELSSKKKAKSTAIQCKTCGQVFNTRTGLRTHVMIHKGEKPFICEVCSKSFRQASHLKTHLRVHTGEKPFKCDICDRGFSHIGSLNEHKNLHSKDKPYKCDVCQRSFAQRKALRVHHCGENPETSTLTFPCPHCPRSFASRRGLAIHRMHQHADDSEPLLQCERCSRTFSNEMSYEEHLLTQCE